LYLVDVIFFLKVIFRMVVQRVEICSLFYLMIGYS
jgi:hypothetical protein